MRKLIILVIGVLSCLPLAAASNVTAKVAFTTKRGQRPNPVETVVWLEPVAGTKVPRAAPVTLTISTQSKMLKPKVMAIPVGSTIDFPNQDPISHNLFSLSPGNSFDLGLYRRGAGKSHRFDTPGIVNIYCNVHPNMSAVVHILDTPYYAIADKTGSATFANVVPGKYRLVAWNEIVGTAQSDIEVTSTGVTGATSVTIDGRAFRASRAHTNKYGQPYSDEHSDEY